MDKQTFLQAKSTFDRIKSLNSEIDSLKNFQNGLRKLSGDYRNIECFIGTNASKNLGMIYFTSGTIELFISEQIRIREKEVEELDEQFNKI